MPRQVTLNPPERLLPYWSYISEGWDAFFDNKEAYHNPYPQNSAHYDAWRWGYFEAVDYGN